MPAVERAAAPTAARPPSAREFEEIQRLAYRTFGLALKTGKEEMVAARLRRLVNGGGFGTFHEYYRHVVEDSTGLALAALIDALATNHTSFLREPDHFDFLRQCVVPEWRGRASVEIWCAAGATGEEVWTLACLLREALPSMSLRIQASDISNKALGIAQTAEYTAERCQSLPAGWLSRYFVAVPAPVAGYRVAPGIRALAKFRRVNLVEPFHWPRPFPAIFCRNVMIYFDRKTREQLIAQLANCLEPGGYLFVGHAESASGMAQGLEYVRPAIYRKPGGRAAP